MASGNQSISTHFRQISTSVSPRPVSLSRVFSRYSRNYAAPTGDTSLAEQIQQLASEVDQQNQAVSELASVVSGSGSALQNAGSSLFGGSVLGGVASSAASGFSWQSIVKDILPLGGLVSGIASLFSSPATPTPLDRYDAPLPLDFSGVLGADGKISQSSYNASGNARASSPGLDLVDAAGGPQSAYARAADGSLKNIAGDPTSRYSGMLDLSATVQNLVASTQPAAAPSTSAAPAQSTVYGDSSGQSSNTQPAAFAGGATTASDPAQQQPVFDGQWFMDHSPYIAAAVRSAMLDYHPVVDVVNDL